MDMNLNGHRALVTGSSAGIGSAIAQALAAEGCAVLVHGRSGERAARVCADLTATGAEAEVVLGDLTEPGTAVRVAEAATRFGVDILVNNAGPLTEHDWDTVDEHHWLTAFGGNVVATAEVTRALLPAMRARGWGRVVNLGSRAVTTPLPHLVEYSAAKAAVVNMTTSLAQQLSGTGITANCVSPGVVVTPTMKRLFLAETGDGTTESDWQRLEPSITQEYAPNPVQRLGRPADVANAVTFLASPRADYITGINLRVDGGITGTP